MRKLILLSCLALAFSALPVSNAGAALIYRAGEGWVEEGADSGVAEKTASAQLHKAEKFEADGDLKRALSAYRTLLRKFPNTGAGPKAQLKIAQLCEAMHQPERAFEAYGKYLTMYPRGEDFDRCVEAQFNIAKLFLNGEKRKLFGVKTFSSMERAQQMFEEIVKNAPYSKLAALAQFNIGQALEKQSKQGEAIAAYQQVVDKYPVDPIAGDAQYQIGYIYFQEANSGSNDRSAREKARDAFEDFMMKYPQSEKVAQARENITHLAGTNTKKTLGIAQFYEKKKDYKAATIYYQDVIKDAPGSPEAVIAKTQMDKMRATVGEVAMQAGPATEGGEKAGKPSKLQARVETASRPDYVGPPAPVVPDEVPPPKPKMRTSGGTQSTPASSSNSAPIEPLQPLPPAPEPALPAR